MLSMSTETVESRRSIRHRLTWIRHCMIQTDRDSQYNINVEDEKKVPVVL